MTTCGQTTCICRRKWSKHLKWKAIWLVQSLGIITRLKQILIPLPIYWSQQQRESFLRQNWFRATNQNFLRSEVPNSIGSKSTIWVLTVKSLALSSIKSEPFLPMKTCISLWSQPKSILFQLFTILFLSSLLKPYRKRFSQNLKLALDIAQKWMT